jgi:hypothetical protein
MHRFAVNLFPALTQRTESKKGCECVFERERERERVAVHSRKNLINQSEIKDWSELCTRAVVLNRSAADHNDTVRYCQGCLQLSLLLSFKPILTYRAGCPKIPIKLQQVKRLRAIALQYKHFFNTYL